MIQAIKEKYSSYEDFLEAKYGLDEGKIALLKSFYCQKDY